MKKKTNNEENIEENFEVKEICENVFLPIGSCSVSGNEDEFKITIFSTDERKYEFNVVNGSIVDCFKNGMKLKKMYGV